MKRIIFSPVTRLSGLLSVELIIDNDIVIEADASGTMFRGYEWIMRGRHITDAVYLTQRICGICSLAHGAAASYLLDDLYDNELSENAQYLRNIMLGADFLQNHIRHFYLFSLPDFVSMPERPPFHGQDLGDCRLNYEDNSRLVSHYFDAIEAAQKSHQLLALFGGKAPHQHSFVHGGVTVAPTADKINQALFLIKEIAGFVKHSMLADTELIAECYDEYFHIGITPKRLLSFGLFKFGTKNQETLWRDGLIDGDFIESPTPDPIKEDIAHAWYNRDLLPDPHKAEAYTWIKSVKYADRHFEVGPLARMAINDVYRGNTSTMDRIMARSIETVLICENIERWLRALEPGPAPISQNKVPVKSTALGITDAMRGVLIHAARISGEQVDKYDIITPTVWNFSPKDELGNRGPVESALVGTPIPDPAMIYTILGRIIRSFDPCISCATHIWMTDKKQTSIVI